MGPVQGCKTRFPESRKKSGVYIIKKNNKIIYVGYSSYDIYKTLYRHFQTWNDKSQDKRVSYKEDYFDSDNDYKVRIVYCTPKKASALEKALILKYQPEDNKNKYDYYLDQETDHEAIYIQSMKEAYEYAPTDQKVPF